LNVTNVAFARRRDAHLWSPASPQRRSRRTVSQAITQAAFGIAAFTVVALGGADGALRAGANAALAHLGLESESIAQSTLPSEASAAATEMIWTIDVDNDGIADFSNPTHGGVRGIDAFGSGNFGAVRDAGKRRHHGVDYVSEPGAEVLAPLSGKVTRIGFAYSGREDLQYVELVNPETQVSARVLYVGPTVAEGDLVSAGDALGVAQDLTGRYPGITNHVHVEMRDAQRRWLDASEQLPSAPVLEAQKQIDAAGS
jgi:murein DD-endopeptidase MepM/ murein hydrolase activator NlpD